MIDPRYGMVQLAQVYQDPLPSHSARYGHYPFDNKLECYTDGKLGTMPVIPIHSCRGTLRTLLATTRHQAFISRHSIPILLRRQTLVAIQWSVKGLGHLETMRMSQAIDLRMCRTIQITYIGTTSDGQIIGANSPDVAQHHPNICIPHHRQMKPARAYE